MSRVTRSALLLAVLGLGLGPSPSAGAGDWPAWRYDATRSGHCPDALPEGLVLRWTLELAEARPAWPSTQDKLQFDRLYEPVVAGKRVFIGSMLRDRLTAYDTETGAELWRFHVDGPVRLAPVVSGDSVLFGSDDGHLYSLAVEDGALRWKFRAGPPRRLLIGNERLIDTWPVRGGPVVRDGIVYFGAGIWPFMGIFLHALEVETGRVVWTQSGEGSRYQTQQHDSPAFSGVAPQGYIAATEDRLVVAGGRTLPAVYDRHTGRFLHYNVASRKMGSKGGGGYEISLAENYYINRGAAYRLDNGEFLTAIDAVLTSPRAVIGHDGEGLRAWSPRWERIETVDRKGQKSTRIEIRKLWSTPVDTKVRRVFAAAGSDLWCLGEGNTILRVDISDLFGGARATWSRTLPDEPLNVVCADDKLFVSTAGGRIHCFGAGERDFDPIASAAAQRLLVPRGATWRYRDDGRAPGADWRSPEFDDSSWATGKARLGYGGDGEVTTLSFGGDERRKHLAAFFRHAFEAEEDHLRADLLLRLVADDGAIVHLNGQEVARVRVPRRGVALIDLAASAGPADEKAFEELRLPVGLLRAGRNVLAVSVHQANRTSSDLGLDLELEALSRDPEVESAPAGAAVIEAVARRLEACRAEGAPVTAGYALVLGLGDGGVAEGLARATDLHVIVVDPDGDRVDDFRRRLDAAGLYGTRVAAIVDAPESVVLPAYFAELITVGATTDGSTTPSPELVQRVFRSLRPYSGVACWPLDEDGHRAFTAAVEDVSLDGARLARSGGLSLLRRPSAPTGAGEWTHENGDVGNSVSSTDTLVRLPLGLLWFGGPSNEGVLPRHGHGPTPHVVGGRCFIEGRHMIRATDIYTGRLLWEREIRDIGKYYDYTSHEPGANLLGSNYVSVEDGVYVVQGTTCRRLDPATGLDLATFQLPKSGAEEHPEWGYVGVSGRFLIAGAQPVLFSSPDFRSGDLGAYKDKKLEETKAWLAALQDFSADEKRGNESDQAWLARNLNRLLLSADLPSHVPLKVRYRTDAEKDEEALRKYLDEVAGRSPGDYRALVLKRQLLHRYYGLPNYSRAPAGKFGSLDRSGSKRLVVLDRYTGEVIWEREAKHQIRHNAIAAGAGKVFWIDRMSSEEVGHYRRRGLPVDEEAAVFAADLASGEVLWSTQKRVFGTWLAYSDDHDVLLQAGSKARDRANDEVGQGMVAYRGASGDVLWQHDEAYEGPCILLEDRIVTQGYSNPGFAYDIQSGQRIQRPHPLTGEAVAWQYKRNYGCNTAIGAPHLLTFRSAAAGYYDLLRDSGTGNLGGFRSGCTSNLIPAGGILCVPDYTRTCTCSYQNQASLALIHSPSTEMWTFSALGWNGGRVESLGLNFGAPGDRRGPDGTLWLDWPSTGGQSPDVPITVDLGTGRTLRYHPTRVGSGELPWVAASAIEGSGKISVRLAAMNRVEVGGEVATAPRLVAENATLSSHAESGNDSARGRALRAGRRGGKVAAHLHHTSLALRGSFTIELRTRVDADIDWIDARKDSADDQQGFVLDNRQVRLRYFVANEAGDDNEPVVTITNKDRRLADHRWHHLAFTYDVATGTGTLWLDGKVVGSHDGPDGRPLWWETDEPKWIVLSALESRGVYLDDLRVTDRVLPTEAFLRGGERPAPVDGLIGLWSMDEAAASDLQPRTYTVRLVGAEIDGAAPGERVFDLLLQERPAARGIDFARLAGGADRSAVVEVTDVKVEDLLEIEVRSTGSRPPLIGGLQVVAEPAPRF